MSATAEDLKELHNFLKRQAVALNPEAPDFQPGASCWPCSVDYIAPHDQYWYRFVRDHFESGYNCGLNAALSQESRLLNCASELVDKQNSTIALLRGHLEHYDKFVKAELRGIKGEAGTEASKPATIADVLQATATYIWLCPCICLLMQTLFGVYGRFRVWSSWLQFLPSKCMGWLRRSLGLLHRLPHQLLMLLINLYLVAVLASRLNLRDSHRVCVQAVCTLPVIFRLHATVLYAIESLERVLLICRLQIKASAMLSIVDVITICTGVVVTCTCVACCLSCPDILSSRGHANEFIPAHPSDAYGNDSAVEHRAANTDNHACCDMVCLHRLGGGGNFETPKLAFLSKAYIPAFAAVSTTQAGAVGEYTMRAQHWHRTGQWLSLDTVLDAVTDTDEDPDFVA
jgi:hypothetical protein